MEQIINFKSKKLMTTDYSLFQTSEEDKEFFESKIFKPDEQLKTLSENFIFENIKMLKGCKIFNNLRESLL